MSVPPGPSRKGPSKQIVIGVIVLVAAAAGTGIFLASGGGTKRPKVVPPISAGAEGPQGVRRWPLPQRTLSAGQADKCNPVFAATTYVEIERIDDQKAVMRFPPTETTAQTIDLEVTANGFKGTFVASDAVVTTLGGYTGDKLRLLTLAYGKVGEPPDQICVWRWDLQT